MAPGGDRATLRLSAADEALIAAATARSDRVVVAVVCGSAVVMPWAESVAAVLVCWYSGVEGGAAVADVLSGDAEPAGRLPFSIPHSEAHLVEFDRNATRVEYGLLHGQWKLDADGNAPHFPFGWGLGYGEVRIESATLDDDAHVIVALAGDGRRPSMAVVFLHAGLDASTHVRPPRRLVGFARALVDGRAEVRVGIDWSMLDLRIDGDWVTERGTYTIEVGRFAGDPDAIALRIDR
jgi:beta-glucosidase